MAHIVPVVDTIATFTSSTRSIANAFSIKKNVEVSLNPFGEGDIFLDTTSDECRKRLCLTHRRIDSTQFNKEGNGDKEHKNNSYELYFPNPIDL